jgi:hypothetical protein
MSNLVVFMNLTLDGGHAGAGPARPTRTRAAASSTAAGRNRCNDPVMGKVAGEGMANTGAMLLGRRTYEDFYAYWPKQTNNPSPRS